MNTLLIIQITIVFCTCYILLLWRNSNNRLLLPSTIHTFTWLVVSVLICLTMLGKIGNYYPSSAESSYDFVAPFILGLVCSSIVGFTIAHLHVNSTCYDTDNPGLNFVELEALLHKFHWIFYVCLFLGILQSYFIYSSVGWYGLADYRIAAVSIERSGYGAFAQQFSGHASILGSFLIGLLGCKHAYTGVNLKEFLIDSLLLASTNLAIGGRIWIITVLLPYFIGYIWQNHINGNSLFNQDTKKMVFVLALFLSVFSIFGSLRNEGSGEGFDKFLYMTDGSRMTNLALSQYPEGSFEYEFGAGSFLSKWIESPMNKTFFDSYSDNIGLSVTVISSMPALYFDFGFWGSFIVWAIVCFLIEFFAQKLRFTNSIFYAIIFIELSKIFFQAPVGRIFYMEMPVAMWLVIIYILRNRIFNTYQ